VPKKFNIFVKMLVQALRGANDQVCIDLLTQADLEALKSKKSGGPNTSISSQASNTKRYFILTYITEFERVHYPLSLTFVEEPEPDQLRRTIERMRNMILMQKSNAFSVQSEPMKSTGFNSYNKIDDFASIEIENERMRRQI
jgi:coiled-coil domain-containing protein 61